MPSSVLVQQLAKRYGQTQAVRDVSFAVEPGEIFGLLGANGAGKTTTLECLAGLREADSGSLAIGGIDVRSQPREAREKIGVALQSTALPDQITAREALILFGSFYRRPVAPDVLLTRFGLTEKADARFVTLSGGQRQRLALALVFVNQPEVVILDEPSASLDVHARHEIHREILKMKQDGYTVLLSTHDLQEAAALCDRIGILHDGRVVATGSPRELVARHSQHQTFELTTDPALTPEDLANLTGIDRLETGATGLRFETLDATATLASITALLRQRGATIVDLQVRKASLEDVFLRSTKDLQVERGERAKA